MHFIFSNEEFLKRLEAAASFSRNESSRFFEKMGVHKKQEKAVIILAISKDCFAGFDIVFTLAEECQKIYNRTVDIERLRISVFNDIISASKSPLLEKASFILFADENLIEPENYPELEKVLPFL